MLRCQYFVHAFPLDDLKAHICYDLHCPCKPKIQEEPDGYIIIHNSYDRREEFEQYGKSHEC